MLLTTEHLKALDELSASEAAGYTTYTPASTLADTFRLLDLQGLVRPETGQSYCLTYMGREALNLLDGMRKQGLLHPTSALAPGWRFLGSEVLAALQAATRASGRVGSITVELLESRGLAETCQDAERNLPYSRLTSFGEAWLAFSKRCQPHLDITPELAEVIHHLPPAYSDPHTFALAPNDLAQLEAMDLLVWSVPDADVFVLTALGLAVSEALKQGAYPTDVAVLDEAIMHVLASLVSDGAASLTAEQRQELQVLGYADAEGALTSAGIVALHAARLFAAETYPRPASFALSAEEIALLSEIQSLLLAGSAPHQAVTKTLLHTALLKPLEKREQEFVGEYGRTIDDRPARRRQLHELQTVRREQEHAFADLTDLDELLESLEACGMLETSGSGPLAVYQLTAHGREAYEQFRATPRGKRVGISAAAVKAITSATGAGRYGAPATAWVRQAHEEGLIGAHGITEAGRFYARMARGVPRRPFLTRREAEALISLPRVEVQAISNSHNDHAAHDGKAEQVYDQLEARGMIDRLVDGHMVRTAAGDMLASALRGALELAHPITPAIVRLLTAIYDVSETLYETDERGYLTSDAWENVKRLAGMDPATFQETVHLAKLGQYLGDANLNEAGLALLTASRNLGWQIVP